MGAVAYFTYQGRLRRAKAIERGLKMVPLLIHLPTSGEDTSAGGRDVREVMREKTAQAEVLYNLISGTATQGFKSTFYGQRHIALELVATNGLVHYYAAVPIALVSTLQKAILTAYPGARIEEVEDHNIFNQEGRLSATMGGELILKADSAYPIATYESLERDPMEAIITTLSGLGKGDGAAIQIMVRPTPAGWAKHATTVTGNLRKGRNKGIAFTPMDLAKAAVVSPKAQIASGDGHSPQLSTIELSTIEKIEDKTKHPTFEVLVRVVVSTQSVAASQQLLRDIATTFVLYDAPGLNGFKFLPAQEIQGLVTAFIFRFFPPEAHGSVLNSVELATLFHLPDAQFTPTASVERQQSKEVDGPTSMSNEGLLFGYNEFRGVRKEVHLSEDDRRRHTYILGQTGTGKSVMLENLAVQDMRAGRGFAFIDPHGETAEKLLGLVPKERAEDVIYFNPADMEFPLGLNLFEFTDPAQKDFLVQESINMLYKLYDPGKTGIIGPRFEHWFRNAALTLMSDPNGSTFIEIPKVFTDTDYLKQKFKYLKDPSVIEFWTKEMAQTSDYHKSEMLGWFVSKFGAYLNNETMRNILGQTKSSFNLRDIMDNKKILIVNLSKGRLGELNSNLLGMIFVIKFQAAAMSRADMDIELRNDFSLYVDEFQNFSTDSFATILSEARKYRLNLIVANQFIGQLSPEIRDAIFGNVGTMVAHRMGPEDAEFMVKQLAPVFEASDLVSMPNLHSSVRMLIGGLPSQPFSMTDLPWVDGVNTELAMAIKQLSAAKFGHSRNEVEADLQQRLTGKAQAEVSAEDIIRTSPPANPAVIEPVQPTIAPVAAPVGSETTVIQPVQPSPVLATIAPASLVVPPPESSQTEVVVQQTIVNEPILVANPLETPINTSHLATTPPPIGAPPVELSPSTSDIKDPVGLSVADITGGKSLPPTDPEVDELALRRQEEAEAATMANDQLADVPLLAVAPPSSVEQVSSDPVLANDPLGAVPLISAPLPVAEKPIVASKEASELVEVNSLNEHVQDTLSETDSSNEPTLVSIPGDTSQNTQNPVITEEQVEVAISEDSSVAASKLGSAHDEQKLASAPTESVAVTAPEAQSTITTVELPDVEPGASSAEETQGAMAGTGGFIHFVDPKLEEVLEEPINELTPPVNEPTSTPSTQLGQKIAAADTSVSETPGTNDSNTTVVVPAVVTNEAKVVETRDTTVETIAPVSSLGAQSLEAKENIPERSTDEILAAVMAAAAKRRGTLDDAPSTPAALTTAQSLPGTTIPLANTPDSTIALNPKVTASDPVESGLSPDESIRQTEHRIDELLSESLLVNRNESRELPTITEPEMLAEQSATTISESEPSQETITQQPDPIDNEPSLPPDAQIIIRAEQLANADSSDHVVTGTEGSRSRLSEPTTQSELLSADLEDYSNTNIGSQKEAIEPLVSVPEKTAPLLGEFTEASTEATLPEKPEVTYPPDEFALPVAESLASEDVAAARAADVNTVSVVASTEVALVTEDPSLSQPIEQATVALEDRPEIDVPVDEAMSPEELEKDAKPVAEDSQAKEAPSGLIMPTTSKPSEETSRPAMGSIKPDKLAKGEVYVDESGNVIVGE